MSSAHGGTSVVAVMDKKESTAAIPGPSSVPKRTSPPKVKQTKGAKGVDNAERRPEKAPQPPMTNSKKSGKQPLQQEAVNLPSGDVKTGKKKQNWKNNKKSTKSKGKVTSNGNAAGPSNHAIAAPAPRVNSELPLSAPSHSMQPHLHDAVAAALVENNLNFRFHEADTRRDCIESHLTNLVGRYTCLQPKCRGRSWPSGIVATVIRLYPNQEYNARSYHQQCIKCEELGSLVVDEAIYVERVVYRLRKWSGVQVERPPFREDRQTRPHESRLCEGCRHGECPWLMRSPLGMTVI